VPDEVDAAVPGEFEYESDGEGKDEDQMDED